MKKVLALLFVLLTSCPIVMLTFFDYLFYRFFTYCVQKKAEDAFLRSVLGGSGDRSLIRFCLKDIFLVQNNSSN